MSVSQYTPNFTYRIDNLANVVYLVDGSSLIHIDDGAAYVNGIPTSALHAIRTTSISLSDGSQLDERYRFTHRLNFTVNGYANINLLNGLYYFIVMDKNGVYWLLNPQFPSKIQHTFTATESGCSTTFTASTVSNHPILQVADLDGTVIPPLECKYENGTVATLLLNEKAFTNAHGNDITYTNDGFKSVVFDKNSLTFNETFDGENVTQSLSFNIKLSDYKSSWHYNLLEFVNNTYCGILQFNDGRSFAFGLTNGLQPSFSLNGSDTDLNAIAITMNGARASYKSPSGYIEGVISGVTQTNWNGTSEHDAYECIDEGVAIYTLEYEADAFGNKTGRYRCLQGMESQFTDYNIVGTFTLAEAIRFTTNKCSTEDTCLFNTSFSQDVLTQDSPTTQFTVQSNSDWSISTSTSHLQATPTTGSPGTTTVSLRATTFGSTTETATITFNYCGGRQMVQRLSISPTYTCFTNGMTAYTVTAREQTVEIGYSCCIDRVSTTAGNWVKSVVFGGGKIRVRVAARTETTPRRAIFTVTNCDGTDTEFRIDQLGWHTEWRDAEGFICQDGDKYTVQVLYSGDTATSIDTPTTQTRAGTLIEEDSFDCRGEGLTRWVKTTDTYCLDGLLYDIYQHQISYDDGVTWEDIQGDTMLSGGTESSICDTQYEHRWLMDKANPWQCGNGVAGSGQTFYSLDEFTTLSRGQGTISFNGTTSARTLSYSTNNGITWSTPASSATVNVTNGTLVRWKGENDGQIGRFSSTVPFEVRGNIMSLMQGDYFKTHSTFEGATNVFQTLLSGSSVTLANNLVMPATALTDSCYLGMFMNCQSLTLAPQLPATALSSRCYGSMFQGCTSLIQAPTVLSATTLAQDCYRDMFQGCTSLIQAPIICATTMAVDSCNSMFNGCTNLATVYDMSASTLSTQCFYSMFRNCTSLVNAPTFTATALTTSCCDSMFLGCTRLNYIKMLATTIPSGALSNWVNGVASSGTFIKAESATLPSGADGIPSGWSINTVR